MNQNIGIDIDGVLTHEGDEKNNIWQKELSNYLGEKIERKKDVFNFIDAYDLSEDTINDFIKEKIEDIYSSVKPAPGARRVMEKLKKYNFKLYLITARSVKYHQLTIDWLNNYDIPYDSLYHDKNKASLAKNKQIELFIEDNAENAKRLLNKDITVIIRDRYHNSNLNNNHQSLYRAYNWEEIRNIIYEYFNLNN